TTYNITYTTPAGACQAISTPIAVTVFANPSATGIVTNDNGSTNGAIDVTVSGGTAPFTYSWDHGPSSEDVTGLAAGDYGITITDVNGCSIYETFTVISTVGVEENPLNSALTIYPNPTNGVMNILLAGEFNVIVKDARGRIVEEKSGVNNLMIDMSSYESALYFVTVQQDENIIVKKIVKH
ncbi:MAG: T9SS type A sorting domain-containing protein, partial [Crocinitomicaceae bacterium]|nr:T9SS type A sorting domain-containing protein [Crocinitomicaceae bacterium]